MMLMTLQATSVFCVGRVKAATNHLFVPDHRHLRQGAFSIVDRSLPSQPTTLLNQLDVAIALSGIGVRRAPRLIWAE